VSLSPVIDFLPMSVTTFTPDFWGRNGLTWDRLLIYKHDCVKNWIAGQEWLLFRISWSNWKYLLQFAGCFAFFLTEGGLDKTRILSENRPSEARGGSSACLGLFHRINNQRVLLLSVIICLLFLFFKIKLLLCLEGPSQSFLSIPRKLSQINWRLFRYSKSFNSCWIYKKMYYLGKCLEKFLAGPGEFWIKGSETVRLDLKKIFDMENSKEMRQNQ